MTMSNPPEALSALWDNPHATPLDACDYWLDRIRELYDERSVAAEQSLTPDQAYDAIALHEGLARFGAILKEADQSDDPVLWLADLIPACVARCDAVVNIFSAEAWRAGCVQLLRSYHEWEPDELPPNRAAWARELLEDLDDAELVCHFLEERGVPAQMLGRMLDEAREWFQVARDKLEQTGSRTVRAICDYHEALALHRAASTDRSQIQHLLDEAERQMTDIGMPGYLRKVAELRASLEDE